MSVQVNKTYRHLFICSSSIIERDRRRIESEDIGLTLFTATSSTIRLMYKERCASTKQPWNITQLHFLLIELQYVYVSCIFNTSMEPYEEISESIRYLRYSNWQLLVKDTGAIKVTFLMVVAISSLVVLIALVMVSGARHW